MKNAIPDQFKSLVAALLLAMGILLAIHMTDLTLTDVTITNSAGEVIGSQPVFFGTSGEDSSEFFVEGNMHHSWYSQGLAQVMPDDCLRELTVNGKSIELVEVAAAGNLCNTLTGVLVDLSSSLSSGVNRVKFRIYDRGGHGRFAIRRSYEDPISAGLALALMFALAYLCVILFSMVGISKNLSLRAQIFAATILVVAFAIRYLFVFYLHPPDSFIFSDMAIYVDRALRIPTGHTGPYDFFQPIGYSLLMAIGASVNAHSFEAMKAMHVLCGVASVFFCWRGTSAIFGEKSGLWSLVIAAFHVPSIAISGFFLAETAFGCVVSAIFYALAKWGGPAGWRRGTILGSLFSVGLWLKGTHAFFAPIFLGVVGIYIARGAASRTNHSQAVKAMGGFAAAVVAGFILHGIYSYQYDGIFRSGPSAGGLNFLEGKCPEKNNADVNGMSFLSPLFSQIGQTSFKEWDQPFYNQGFFWREGWQCVVKNPWQLFTDIKQIGYLFAGNELWPVNTTQYADLTRLYAIWFAIWLYPAMVIGSFRIMLDASWKKLVPFLPIAALFFCVWFFKSEIRFRIPFDTLLISISVYGWSHVPFSLRWFARK
jgi:hypothetical protein